MIDGATMRLRIEARAFGVLQFGCVGVLVLLGVAAYLIRDLTGHDQLLGLVPLFDVGNENGLATFFSAVNLLLAGLLSYLLYASAPRSPAPTHRRWRWLALVFVYLAIDEASMIHENFSRLGDFLGDGSMIVPRHAWLLFGVPFALVAAILFVPLLGTLQRSTATLFAVGGVAFAAGALGFEFVGSWMINHGAGADTLAYDIRRVVEEGLEMFSIALFNWAAVREMALRRSRLDIAAVPRQSD